MKNRRETFTFVFVFLTVFYLAREVIQCLS